MNTFIINRSEIEERLDPFFYNNKPDFSQYIKLSKIATVKGGKRIPLGKTYSDIPTDYLYLRVADMVDDTADYNSLKTIDSEVYKVLINYEMVEGDIALSIAGSIGKVLCARNIPSSKKIILTENCAKIQVKREIIIPEYMALLLTLDATQKQIDLNYIQTTIPKLGLDRIRNIYIPKVPDLRKQQKIVAFYERTKEHSNQKNKESKQLLASIDTYLLNELGITIAPKDNSLKNRIFTISSSYITGRRWDCPSNSGTFSLHSQKFDNRNLREIVIINPPVMFPSNISDVTFIPMESVDECYGEVDEYLSKSVSETTGFTRFQQDDIIWAKITPCMQNGKSAIVKQTINGYACGSTEFYVLRCKKNIIDTEYLFNIMHMKQLRDFAICYFGGSAGQQRVSKDFFAELVIPLPPLSKQKEIAEHIKQIRSDAKKLQNEAEQILSDAKQQVEKMILGEQNNE